MNSRKLKVRSQGAVEAVTPASATAQSSRTTHEGRHGRLANVLDLSGLMLVLQKLAGRTLVAIGVGAQLGTVFICAAILLLGPSVALGLLP